jgi:hypothetical protein
LVEIALRSHSGHGIEFDPINLKAPVFKVFEHDSPAAAHVQDTTFGYQSPYCSCPQVSEKADNPFHSADEFPCSVAIVVTIIIGCQRLRFGHRMKKGSVTVCTLIQRPGLCPNVLISRTEARGL